MKLILVSHSVWFENIILIRFKIRIIYIAKIAKFEVKDKIQVMKIKIQKIFLQLFYIILV
mgnify:CR=1 FL=1